ncbi:Uu.00g101860.m01.CDS01 [Anthostomella pinea]|uniref:Uu.00g101860.m01.CDS01 n=1 Tax=Anthostomella pinea TaxID=933095 RepID=A0AAI8VDB5_9PEZI|nr:Uu.00g101860.m01.CDS01 [Anthostomella pinea]
MQLEPDTTRPVLKKSRAGCKECRRRKVKAFESDILMSPLLALSALHLHAHTPDDHLLSLSLSKYVDRSLVNQRTWIAQCGGGGAPRLPMQLFLAAIMLIYMSWLLTNRSQPGEEYRVPMQVFQMAEGARIIFQRKSGYFRDLGFDRWDLPPPTQDPTPLSPESLRWLCEMEDDIQHLLDGFCVESLPDKERRAYIQAAEYLRYVYRNSFGDIDHTRSLLSPIMGRMGIDFLQLLEACEPPALALFARAFVLLGSLEESWWLNGKGPYEVVGRNIKGILGLMPAKDRWSMDLPIRAISGVVKLTRPGEGQVSPGVYSPQAQMQSSRTLSLSPGSSTEGGQEWG